MWALFWGTSTITTTPMQWRSQAGLRRRRRHQQRRGEGRNDVGTTRHPILEAANHAPRSSSPLMPRKPRRHRRRRRGIGGEDGGNLHLGWRRTRREEKTTTKMMRGDRRTRVGRFVVRGRRRGGRWDALVSVVGRWRRRPWRGGSAPDDGTEVVGIGRQRIVG